MSRQAASVAACRLMSSRYR